MLNLTVKSIPDNGKSPITILACSEVRYFVQDKKVRLDGTDDPIGHVEITGPGMVYVMNANGATVASYRLN